jgi:TonB-linked SusC/RagA family outer membrane protein
MTYFGQKTVKGIVKDGFGDLLPGVSILIKGTMKGTVSKFDGDYTIKVPSNESVLVFSYLGMKPKEVQVGDKTEINVVLEAEENSLEEIVIIGYGSVKKKDLTGSVGAVKAEMFAETQTTSALSALQGRVAGAQITRQSGEPGSSINVKIRGANSVFGNTSPLFVIDGVQIDINSNEVANATGSQSTLDPLSTINPNDIESFEVLKDASATAIFGSRGANGVIIITTKSGKSGKSSIEFNSLLTVGESSKILDVLSPEEYITYQQERGNNQFLARDLDNDGIFESPRDFTQYDSYNYQDKILRTGVTQQYNFSLNTGNEKTRVSASAGFLEQEGIVLNNDFSRYTLRTRINHKHSDKLQFGINMNGAFSETTGVASNGGLDNFNGITQLLVIANPWRLLDEEINQELNENISPLTLIEEAEKEVRLFRVLGSMYGTYKINTNLSFRSQIGLNYSQSKSKVYYGSNTSWGNQWNGRAIINEVGTYSYNFTNQFNYRKRFNKNNRIDAMAAFESSMYNFERFLNDISGFDIESLGYDNISIGQSPLTYDTLRTQSKRLSYFGRVNYTLQDKYLFTASFRADGSDKFGQGNRWGYFPSGAFAWKASEEDFVKNIKEISNLKMRVSYGVTGNERIPPYSYFSSMENAFYAHNGGQILGIAPSSLANENLKWETTAQYDAGIDLGLFDNRINLTLDYYLKETTDMLLNAPVSAQSGYANQVLNIGQINNSGWEISLSTTNIQTDAFRWTTDFNINFNSNEVVDLGGADFIPVVVPGGWLTSPGRVIVGEAIGAMYGFVYDGVYQTGDFTWQNDSDTSIPHDSRNYILKPGIVDSQLVTPRPGAKKYKDLTGDGIIDENGDRQIIGNSIPKHFGGITNTFKYKNFDVSFLLQWSYGNDIFNAGRLRTHGFEPFMNLERDFYDNSWRATNESNIYPEFGRVDAVTSSYFVEDGSFLRLQNVNFGYQVPRTLIEKYGIQDLKVFFVGTNLITWSNYSGFDPEVSSNNPLISGYERISYPRVRSFSLGLNFKF